jgi:tetrahydromethanopterin S-methyltransferase subunit G
MSVSIESDLKEILSRFEQKLDKVAEDVGILKIGTAKIETKLDSLDKRLEKVEDSQKAQVWTLIGILATAVLGILVAGARILFFWHNP